MNLESILNENRIVFKINANTKEGIIREISKLFINGDIVEEKDIDKLVLDLMERENLSSTGMQDGIAIPHAKSKVVKKIALAVAIDKEGKNFDSMDDIVSSLFFMIVAPEHSGQEHLEILQKISKLSFKEDKLEEMLNTNSKEKVIEILTEL